jgi:hypothetical protein
MLNRLLPHNHRITTNAYAGNVEHEFACAAETVCHNRKNMTHHVQEFIIKPDRQRSGTISGDRNRDLVPFTGARNTCWNTGQFNATTIPSDYCNTQSLSPIAAFSNAWLYHSLLKSVELMLDADAHTHQSRQHDTSQICVPIVSRPA